MKVKVFRPNDHGKIEFTPNELEELLNEVYSEGFDDGENSGANKSSYTWTAPGIGTWYTEIKPTLINDAAVAEQGKEIDTTSLKNLPKEIQADFDSVTRAIAHLVKNTGVKEKPSCFDELAKELNF